MTRRKSRVVVNTAIYLHGTSGSARATAALVDTLRQLPYAEVIESSLARRGGTSKSLTALRDASWDLWRASRSTPDVDLLVSPCNIGFRGAARAHLLVVHDVMAIDHPELFDRRFRTYFRALVPPSIRSADRVLTPSVHSRESILRRVPGADVRVVPWAHAGSLRTAAWPATRTVLMVGATEPVKNQAVGIAAVRRLREASGADVRLRVVGPAGRAEPAVRAALAGCDPEHVWTSREVDVPAEVLADAYSSSWLLLQPSLDEGFGLPLVEAAATGLPVVHSGRGALPEVMPDIDAGGINPDALAVAMTPLLDRTAWERQSARSAEHAGRYAPAAFGDAVRRHVEDLLGQQRSVSQLDRPGAS